MINKKHNQCDSNNINIYKIKKGNKTYEIYKTTKLGEGSYSSVCLGRMIDETPTENQFVAIKKIVKSTLSPRGLSMLTTEIDIIKEMITHDHKNIVRCYDVIDDIDTIYIVMEYCENGDLSSLLVGKPLKYNHTKYYFGQIVSALKYLNTKNIIHRDIKPKNILITNKAHTIKLCDFGFAKHSNGLKKIMTVCGSPLYMAPEIYQKIGYNESVDVWALGIILYEMLFGVHPLKNYNDPKKIADSISTVDIIIPHNVNYVEPECVILLEHMLQRQKHDRISMTELFNNKWVISCTNQVVSSIHLYEEKKIEQTLSTISISHVQSIDQTNQVTESDQEINLVFEMDE